MTVWQAILLAVLATSLMNFGMALQKRGASKLPKIGSEKGVVKAFFTSRVWLAGTGALLGGWGLFFVSTKFAPISIIQPTLGVGLAVLAVFSVFYLKEKIKALEWIAVFGMIVGMVLLGVSTAGEEKVRGITPEWFRLILITAAILAISLISYLLGRRGKLGALRVDSLLGMVSGLFVGLGALFIKAMFLCAEAGKPLLAYLICLPVLIFSYLVGIGVMQSGFQHGKALIVVSLEAVLNKVVAIIGGIIALGEALPQERAMSAIRIVAFSVILLGTALLSRFGGEEIAESFSENLRGEA